MQKGRRLSADLRVKREKERDIAPLPFGRVSLKSKK